MPTAIGEVLHQAFFSAISFAPKKYGRISKSIFPSTIIFTRFVKALRKFCSVCLFYLAVKSFKVWGEMPSNPAQELLGKDMRAFWTRNSEVKKQSISVVRNRASFPLRMIQLEGSVDVGREICSLRVVYCHSDSGHNIIFVYFSANGTQWSVELAFLLRFSVAFRSFLTNAIPNTLVDNCTE